MTREDAIKQLTSLRIHSQGRRLDRDIEALDMAIKALEQQSFINKPCISEGVCREDRIQVLDKIRAELIQSIQNGTLKIECGNEELFRIIDKYKKESEEEK